MSYNLKIVILFSEGGGGLILGREDKNLVGGESTAGVIFPDEGGATPPSPTVGKTLQPLIWFSPPSPQFMFSSVNPSHSPATQFVFPHHEDIYKAFHFKTCLIIVFPHNEAIVVYNIAI